MSSLPGLDLESLLCWYLNLVVVGRGDANTSLMIAEAIGTIPQRRRLTEEQFRPLVGMYEDVREQAERSLTDFDEETQSWRAYAGYAFDDVLTQGRWERARDYLNALSPP